MTPSRSLLMIASSDDSTTAARRRTARSAALRSEMSRAIFDAPIDRAGVVEDRGHAQGNRHQPSVLGDSNGLEVADRPPGADLAEHVVLFALPVGRDDHPDRPADRLFSRIAEHPLRGLVPRSDRAVEVLADDGVVGRFDHAREMEMIQVAGITAHRQPRRSSSPCLPIMGRRRRAAAWRASTAAGQRRRAPPDSDGAEGQGQITVGSDSTPAC